MSEEEIKRYLAAIGSKGGKAGRGVRKLRGGTKYYRRISKLAAKARRLRKAERAGPRPRNGGQNEQ